MVIAGGNAAKFVVYPIDVSDTPTRRLTNWAVMARIATGNGAPPTSQDWCRSGHLGEPLHFVRRFRLDFIDPMAIIEESPRFSRFPTAIATPFPTGRSDEPRCWAMPHIRCIRSEAMGLVRRSWTRAR